MFSCKAKNLIVVLASIVTVVTPSILQAARVDNIKVVRVRAYNNDGNAHIDLSQSISVACGTRLRIPANKGQDNVMKIALAAVLSGNFVTVESDDAKSGNFCNLKFIWLTGRQ